MVKHINKPMQIDRNGKGEFYNAETGALVSVARFTVTRTEVTPLAIGCGDKSIGQIIDEYVTAVAVEGDDIASFAIDLQPHEWQAIKEAITSKWKPE